MSSGDKAVIDLVEDLSIWGVPGLVVDSFVHEVRTFDRYLPACDKIVQSESIFIWTLMQTCLSLADVGFTGQLFRSRLSSPTSRYDLGRLGMLTSVVHKIDPWPPLLSHLLVHVC
jgi:hypothetical protein